MFDKIVLPILLCAIIGLVSLNFYSIGNIMYEDYLKREARINAWENYIPQISENDLNGAVLSGQAEILLKLSSLAKNK